MPKCKNDIKRSYKGDEPSPKGLGFCAHAENLGKIRLGLDGNEWIIKSNQNGTKRWIKYKKNIIKKGVSLDSYKKYYTYDIENTKSFLIYVKKDVYIYKKNEDNSYNKLVSKILSPKKIFIGKSIFFQTSKYNLSYGKEFDGNTILLQLNDNSEYIIITDSNIQKFNLKITNDKILKFYSFIIHNSIFPIAIGEKFIYFFNDYEGYLPKSEFPKNNFEGYLDVCIELNPFMVSITNHKIKNNKISLDEFKDMKKKSLNEIPLKKVKNLAILYGVTTSGSKKELADRIENLRNVIFYKK